MTTPPDPVLSYHGSTARLSRLARLAFILSIISAITFFLVLPSLIALIIAVIANQRIQKNPQRLSGQGFATCAATVSLCSFCLGVFAFVLLPDCGSHPRGKPRSSCAANLRGIANSLLIYAAQNNDQFPVVAYAPYTPAPELPHRLRNRRPHDQPQPGRLHVLPSAISQAGKCGRFSSGSLSLSQEMSSETFHVQIRHK